MEFLKKLFLKDNIVENKDTVPELSKTVSNNFQENGSQNVPENIVFTQTPVNLMSKLFRNQKNALPETLYEDEAWAPETKFVGLFHKHRVITEEHFSSSSAPQ